MSYFGPKKGLLMLAIFIWTVGDIAGAVLLGILLTCWAFYVFVELLDRIRVWWIRRMR